MLLRLPALAGDDEGARDRAGEGKTRSNGIFSPKVCLSFAILLRRVSVAGGGTGVVGVTGIDMPVAVDGVGGSARMRRSEGGMGTAFRRRTSGLGSSFERLGFAEYDLGSGRVSELVRGGESASDATDEFVDEV